MREGQNRGGRLNVLPERGQLGEPLSWRVGRMSTARLVRWSWRVGGGAGESRIGCSRAKVHRGPRLVGAGGRVAAGAMAPRDGLGPCGRVRPRAPSRSRRTGANRAHDARRRVALRRHGGRRDAGRVSGERGAAIDRPEQLGARVRVRVGERMATSAWAQLVERTRARRRQVLAIRRAVLRPSRDRAGDAPSGPRGRDRRRPGRHRGGAWA